MKRTHYTDELEENVGKEVVVSGWVHDVRLIGGINFLILRDNRGLVQVTAPKGKVPQKILDVYSKLHQEDVVTVKGGVVKAKNAKVGIEIIPSEIEIVNKAHVPLPLDPRGVVNTNFDTRLDWRVLDLRRNEVQAIFNIQAKLVEGIEEYLRKNNFLQVFTPSMIGGISEGGSEVFKINHFGKDAFLRQDPQLHREMLIAAGFDKIFEIGPSWRAEMSDTPRHLTELRSCAVELAFIEDETDTIRVEEEMIVHAIKKVVDDCEKELGIIGKDIQVPKKPFPELRFPKIYEILEELGKKIKFGEDYDRESESLLGKYVKEKCKSDFFFVNRFPSKTKSFYVMKVDEEPQWARSVDLIFKGIEQSSGGQREHRYEKIIQQVKENKLNPESIKWFTEPFKYGAPPMGGFCIGLERFTMQLLDLKNIKEAVLFSRYPGRIQP